MVSSGLNSGWTGLQGESLQPPKLGQPRLGHKAIDALIHTEAQVLQVCPHAPQQLPEKSRKTKRKSQSDVFAKRS